MSVLLSLLFIGLALVSPAAWVNDYPPDVREKYGPMDERASRLRKLAGYKDVGFHLRAFAKGLAGSALGSLLVALVAWLVSVL
jgi:hypothetical protein